MSADTKLPGDKPLVINAEAGSVVTVYAVEIQHNHYAYPGWLDDLCRERIAAALAGGAGKSEGDQ